MYLNNLLIFSEVGNNFLILPAVKNKFFLFMFVPKMYIGRVIPKHVKDPRAPVDKSRVLIPGVTGQIPELLRIAVKLHRHHYR